MNKRQRKKSSQASQIKYLESRVKRVEADNKSLYTILYEDAVNEAKQAAERTDFQGNSRDAYQEYQAYCELGEGACDPGERYRLAIAFLSFVCHDYLFRGDGDFIKIEMSDEIQR